MSKDSIKTSRQSQNLIDRIEDRLLDAPDGLHLLGSPADKESLRAALESGMSEDSLGLWESWDGLELGNGDLTVFPLKGQIQLTEDRRAQLAKGDRVIGEKGGGLLVLCEDPWEEGADVILVEEDGERAPYASCVERLVLATLGELSVLLDEDGEFRDELFDEDGELSLNTERRLTRRHLDFDPDAPLARFRLGQLLRHEGAYRAARSELKKAIRRAPAFAWLHYELGLAFLEDIGLPEGKGNNESAKRSFQKAVDAASDPGLEALFEAWLLLVSPDGEEREALLRSVQDKAPGFLQAQESGLREAMENEDWLRAGELLALCLALAPKNINILSLRAQVQEKLSESLARRKAVAHEEESSQDS